MKPLTREGLVGILTRIKDAENIVIDDDAQEFIINISNNTVKILVNYMEKFKLLDERVTLDRAVQLCSNISFFALAEYVKFVLEQNLPEAIKLIYEIYDKGYSVMDILDNFFFFVKTTPLIAEDHKYVIIPCICKYITIFHEIHEDEIELALFTNNLVDLLSKR
jgi:DNA polymerase III gamma/tau subunit